MSSATVQNYRPSIKAKEKEVIESTCLENGTKLRRVHFAGIVKLQIKVNKEPRLMAVGCFRMWVFKKNNKTVEHEFSLVDITQIRGDADRVQLTVRPPAGSKPTEPIVELDLQAEDVQELLKGIRQARRMYNPVTSATCSIAENILLPLDEDMDRGPCDGMQEAYYSHCDYTSSPIVAAFVQYIHTLDKRPREDSSAQGLYRGDVADVDEFLGVEVSHTGGDLGKLDTLPMIGSLEHNPRFRTVRFNDISNKALAPFVTNVVGSVRLMTTLQLRNYEAFNPKTMNLFVDALASAPVLHRVDFTGTPLSGVGGQLGDVFARATHPISELILDGCKIPGKSLISLFQAFEANYGASLALRSLVLSNNSMDALSSKALAEFIESCGATSQLQRLFLANTKADFTAIGGALRHANALEELDLSHNKLDAAAGNLLEAVVEEKRTPPSKVRYLNVQSCQLADATRKCVEVFLASKTSAKDKHLVVGDNKISAKVLAKAIASSNNVSVLDVSQSKWKAEEAEEILAAIGKITTLQTLVLDGSLTVKPTDKMFTALGQLHTDLNGSLRRLSMRNCGGLLKSCGVSSPAGAATWINAIGGSQLEYLDLTHSQLGDAALILLAQQLQSHKTLTTVCLDGNDPSFHSIMALLTAIRSSNRPELRLAPMWEDGAKAAANLSSQPEKRDRLCAAFSALRLRSPDVVPSFEPAAAIGGHGGAALYPLVFLESSAAVVTSVPTMVPVPDNLKTRQDARRAERAAAAPAKEETAAHADADADGKPASSKAGKDAKEEKSGESTEGDEEAPKDEKEEKKEEKEEDEEEEEEDKKGEKKEEKKGDKKEEKKEEKKDDEKEEEDSEEAKPKKSEEEAKPKKSEEEAKPKKSEEEAKPAADEEKKKKSEKVEGGEDKDKKKKKKKASKPAEEEGGEERKHRKSTKKTE